MTAPLSQRTKQLRGTFRQSRGSEPVVALAFKRVPAVPKHLGEHGAQAWRTFGRILVESQILCGLFVPAFTLLCELYEEREKLKADVGKNGISYTTKNRAGDLMHRTRPEVFQLRQVEKSLRQSMQSFGLTPSTLLNIGKPAPSTDDDAMERLLSSGYK